MAKTVEPDQLERTIATCLRSLLPPDHAARNAEFDASTVLFGPGALLDSMGLVTLVVDVEQQVLQEYGLSVTLADDRAMSQRNSPFRTIGTLRDYIGLLAREAAPHG
jgi:acyl carrier protein